MVNSSRGARVGVALGVCVGIGVALGVRVMVAVGDGVMVGVWLGNIVVLDGGTCEDVGVATLTLPQAANQQQRNTTTINDLLLHLFGDREE